MVFFFKGRWVWISEFRLWFVRVNHGFAELADDGDDSIRLPKASIVEVFILVLAHVFEFGVNISYEPERPPSPLRYLRIENSTPSRHSHPISTMVGHQHIDRARNIVDVQSLDESRQWYTGAPSYNSITPILRPSHRKPNPAAASFDLPLLERSTSFSPASTKKKKRPAPVKPSDDFILGYFEDSSSSDEKGKEERKSCLPIAEMILYPIDGLLFLCGK